MNARTVICSPRLVRPLWALTVALMVAGCAAPRNQAPVEDRSARPTAQPSAPTAVPVPPAGTVRPEATKPPPPGAENAGKPGYYTVKPGDTLIRIGLDTGQNWRDIGRWNNLDNPNLIEVGQVLRVVAPGVDPSAPATRAVAPGRVETRPLPAATAASGSAPAGAVASGSSAPAVAPVASASAPRAAPASPSAAGAGPEEDVVWQWPAAGTVTTPFDEVRNKGIGIAGKAGDAVAAAADGRVVYVGSGIRGYGNLVIVMHNKTFLTAYAHNQTILVKEDQAVRRGQKIAEMGSSDTDRVQLHFEIRRQGVPVDPTRLLPQR